MVFEKELMTAYNAKIQRGLLRFLGGNRRIIKNEELMLKTQLSSGTISKLLTELSIINIDGIYYRSVGYVELALKDLKGVQLELKIRELLKDPLVNLNNVIEISGLTEDQIAKVKHKKLLKVV